MLILASTTDKLQVITGSAGQIDVHASWMDNVSGAVNPGRTNTPTITTAAATDVVAPPAAGVIRNIKVVTVHNRGSAPNDITFRHTDGTTAVELHKVTVAAGETWQYIDQIGFKSGLFAPPPVTVTAAANVTAADRGRVFRLVNNNALAAGAYNLTHTMSAASVGPGFSYTVNNETQVSMVATDTNSPTTAPYRHCTVNIVPTGGETIDGLAQRKCLAAQSYVVMSDGTNWFTIGRQTSNLLARVNVASTITFINMSFPADYMTLLVEADNCVVQDTFTQLYGQFSFDTLTWPDAAHGARYWWRSINAAGAGLTNPVTGLAVEQNAIALGYPTNVGTPDGSMSLRLKPDLGGRGPNYMVFSRFTVANDGDQGMLQIFGYAPVAPSRITNLTVYNYNHTPVAFGALSKFLTGSFSIRGMV